MRRRVVFRCVALLCLVAGLMVGIGRAQVITGEIDGTVEDATGARIPGATVIITNTDTNEVVRTLKTNSSGDYTASTLQVGNYKIAFSAPGFNPQTLTDIAVNVGDTLTKSAKLVPGTSTDVTVTADTGIAPNTETNENSSLIGNTEIKELALNTRNFEQMLLLQPGVSYGGPDELETGQVDPSGSRNAHQLSVNGLQPTQVQFLLNGADMLNHTSNGQVSVFPNVDAIQQIQTTRNNYGAQYGGGGSAQTSIVTKAGGASYHGDAYFFARNEIFDATPVFDLISNPQIAKPEDRQYTFGYTLGGPLFIPKIYPRSRSKTFFFFSQEFRRLTLSVQNANTTFPTLGNTYGYFTAQVCAKYAVSPTGTVTCAVQSVPVTSSPYGSQYKYRICSPDDLATPCPAGAPSIDAISEDYIKDVFRPAVLSQPASNPLTPNDVIFQQQSTTSETQELVRIDHQFSERLNAFFSFINDPITQNIPNSIYRGGGFPTVSGTNVQSYGRDYLGHITYARRNTVFEVGFSFLPYETAAYPTGSALASNSPDAKAENANLPYANNTGRIPAVIVVAAFWGAVGNFVDHSSTTQAFENTTISLGRHNLYVGGNFEHLTDRANPGTTNSGQFQFSTAMVGNGVTQFDSEFAQFLSGQDTTFTQSSVDANEQPHENLYEGYIQDNWRATATLTLNGGVRYSIFQAPGDFSPNTTGAFPQGKLGVFQPQGYNPATAPTIGTTGLICLPNPNIPGTSVGAGCTGIAVNNTPNFTNGIVGGGNANGTSPYGHAVSRTPLLDFAPRVGFAWNVYGDGKTSIRGGFGIYYEQQPLVTFQNAIAGNPSYVQNPVYTATTFENPTVTIGTPSVGTQALSYIAGITRNWQQPYVEGFNLDVQQQLTKSILIDVGYVGNNTVHLQGEEDLNQAPPYLYSYTGVTGCSGGPTSVPYPPTAANCYPQSGIKTQYLNQLRPYQGYGPIDFVSTRFFADYNGLQTTFLDRVSKKLTVALNYTFSKALANDGGPPNGNGGQQQFDPQNRYNIHTEWGPTLLDRRNILVAHFVYLLPTHSSFHGFLGGLLNGYEVSGIVQLVGGLRQTAFNSTYDVAGQGNEATGTNAQTRPQLNFNPNNDPQRLISQKPGQGPEWFKHDLATPTNIAAKTNPVNPYTATWDQAPLPGHIGGNESIGAIVGPGYESFNLDLFKNFELPENTKLQFRVEAFNLPNHVNWKNLQTQAANAAFGTITSAYDNRELQLGVKVTF